jgi:uncharacterized protein (DUF433 family)
MTLTYHHTDAELLRQADKNLILWLDWARSIGIDFDVFDGDLKIIEHGVPVNELEQARRGAAEGCDDCAKELPRLEREAVDKAAVAAAVTFLATEREADEQAAAARAKLETEA